MAIFDPVTLTWQGVDHEIAPDKIMGLIARLEDVVTLAEISAAAQRGSMPLGKLAMAYGSALRYAGARASDDEVYASFFAGDASADTIATAVGGLLAMMVPPQRVAQPAATAKKPAAARRS